MAEKEKNELHTKKMKEMQILSESMQEAEIAKKKIKPKEEISYKFEEYGRDHNKDVESRKEGERQKKRDLICNQLKTLSVKQKNISKEMQGQYKGTIEVPSFKQKPSYKLEYKKLLLQQIEIDREKRKLAKQYMKLKEDESIEKNADTPEKSIHQALKQEQISLRNKKENTKVSLMLMKILF